MRDGVVGAVRGNGANTDLIAKQPDKAAAMPGLRLQTIAKGSLCKLCGQKLHSEPPFLRYAHRTKCAIPITMLNPPLSSVFGRRAVNFEYVRKSITSAGRRVAEV